MALLIFLFLHLISVVYSQNDKPKFSGNFDVDYDEFSLVCEIPMAESGHADYICNLYTGHLQFLNGTSKSMNSGSSACIFITPKNYLISRLQAAKSQEVSCTYSPKSDPSNASAMSEKFSITKWLPGKTEFFITETSTTASPFSSPSLINTKGLTTVPASTHPRRSSPVPASTHPRQSSPLPASTHPRQSSAASFQASTAKTAVHINPTNNPTAGIWTFIVMSLTGGSILLAGVAILLCCFIRKRRTKSSTRGTQGHMMAMINMEECGQGTRVYSEITSVPMPSLYSGRVMPIHKGDYSGPHVDIYSEITTVPPTLQSFGPQNILGESSTATEDDLHHTYCAIPDAHVVSQQNDGLSALLQEH